MSQTCNAFFIFHTQETIHYRYGYMISEMTPERAHSLVAVDQSKDLALALTSTDHQTLYAVGRYCLDPTGKKSRGRGRGGGNPCEDSASPDFFSKP